MAPFSIGFNYLKAAVLLRGDSLLLTVMFPGVSCTHLVNFGRMKPCVNYGATKTLYVLNGDWSFPYLIILI